MSKKSRRLRVLSYNIHQGLTIHRQKIALSILKDAIRSQEADVVLLQEVAGNDRGGGKTDTQLEGLADAIWPYQAFHHNAVFAGGFHGNAILSRHPIQKWKHHDLTVKPLDKRGMLHAEILIPEINLPVEIMAIHLGLLQFERRQQLTKVCNYISKLSEGANCILGGDFNDWRTLVSKRLANRVGLQEAHLSQTKKHARTFPARFPVLKLDRIYYRGLTIKHAKVLRGRPWMYLSDHLPLFAEFELPE